jgi:hypothetical protein
VSGWRGRSFKRLLSTAWRLASGLGIEIWKVPSNVRNDALENVPKANGLQNLSGRRTREADLRRTPRARDGPEKAPFDGPEMAPSDGPFAAESTAPLSQHPLADGSYRAPETDFFRRRRTLSRLLRSFRGPPECPSKGRSLKGPFRSSRQFEESLKRVRDGKPLSTISNLLQTLDGPLGARRPRRRPLTTARDRRGRRSAVGRRRPGDGRGDSCAARLQTPPIRGPVGANA